MSVDCHCAFLLLYGVCSVVFGEATSRRCGGHHSYIINADPEGSGVPRNFVRGGSTNSVEDRENGDLGAVAP
jgi:hypothetical protein